MTAYPKKRMKMCLALCGALMGATPSYAAMPEPWGLGMQPAATSIQSWINDFHNVMLVIIFGVSIFVLALLLYVVARYNRRANPDPGRTTHNIKLEIIWTAIPCLIVAFIAWLSFPLLYKIDRMPPPDLTLKVTGHQWYWSYEYPDQGIESFDSLGLWGDPSVSDDAAMKAAQEALAHWIVKEKPQRLLEVDNRAVVPVGKVVRVQITAADVEHSWFVPSLGLNRMAVPGRLNQVWFKLEKEGVYYGQCSMICGTNHGYMPIVVEGVSQAQFDAWAASKKAKADRGPARHFASN